MQTNTKHSVTNAIIGIWTVLLTTFVVGTLYFAKEVLIPLALAALLTFLLAPLVSRMERIIGRISAVLLVTVMIFLCASMVTWVFSRQLVDLAGKLPDYKENLHTRIHAFQLPGGGFTRFSQAIEDLKNDFVGAKPTKPENVPVAQPASTASPALPDIFHSNPLSVAQMVMAPLLGPIGTAGLVALLVIFMLFKREDLRRRFIRMIGLGRINMTTRAMDDAGARVARYLSRLLMVNLSFGVIIAIGLFFIGIPNAILWGCLAALLRFIPYIGCWIAAIMPLALSLAVSTSWAVPIMVMALFVGLELLNSNMLEPWLYGASTGVSSFALIVAAVFWTWLWGPVGLLLSTPLTVCLVVM
ncbi:MAG: AI-2E family transporter, partial [Chthoniobacterales bacterium]